MWRACSRKANRSFVSGPTAPAPLVSSVNAIAKSLLILRHYPFDRHSLRIVFGLPGYTDSELRVEQSPCRTSPRGYPSAPVELFDVRTTRRPSILPTAPGSDLSNLDLLIELDVKRQPMFVLRLVVGPLFLVVFCPGRCFWMDRASVGDRMSVSFVGLLTAVAYQIILGDILPHIAYLTPVNVFVNLSFILMCASIVVNLLVGELNRSGRGDKADALDNRCKVAFPVVYVSLIGIVSVIFALRF